MIAFFLLTFALMWACFITVAAVPVPLNSVAGAALAYLGTFAPGIVALGFTARDGGTREIGAFFRRVFSGAPGPGWWIFAAGLMLAIKLSAAVVHRVALGEWPRFGPDAVWLMLVATFFSTPFQAGEELGWRGFALPRLTHRVGLARAGLLLGVIWAVWHIPQFYIREADTYHQAFLTYALQVVAISVVMAWLYDRTRNLLVVMLLHAAINNTKDIVPSGLPDAPGVFSLHASPISWISAGLLWVVAGVLLYRMSAGRSRRSA